jgi:hypothetical protein
MDLSGTPLKRKFGWRPQLIHVKRVHVPSALILRNNDIFDSDEIEASARAKRKKKKWKDTRRRLVTGNRLHVSIWRKGIDKLYAIGANLFYRNEDKLKRRPAALLKLGIKRKLDPKSMIHSVEPR